MTLEPQNNYYGMYPLIVGIMNVKKNYALTGGTKLLLDVGGKKSIFMRVKIDSSNFSTVSCLDKTLSRSGFSICAM